MYKKLIASLCLLLAVTGCPGGSGSAGTPAAPVAEVTEVPLPPPNPLPLPILPSGLSLVETSSGLESEYAAVQTVNHSAFTLVKIPGAYANIYSELGAEYAGHPGLGSRVGVIDSGFDVSHPSFVGKDVTIFEALSDRVVRVETGNSERLIAFHGTAVSGTATARPTRSSDPSLSIQGVAPAASLTVIVVPLGSGSPPNQEISAASESQLLTRGFDRYSRAIRFMLDPARQHLDALNLSFGLISNVEDYSEETLRMAFPETLTALAQQYRQDKVVVVMAAGNSNRKRCVAGSLSCTIEEPDFLDPTVIRTLFDGSSPSIYSGLMAKILELRGHTVAVVSVNPVTGLISDFSQRCGIAAQWCIAAPGENIPIPVSRVRSDGVDHRIGSRSGTSFAAPIVSGGLALLKQIFRGQMTGPQMLLRLFETADKSGSYADTAVYGQGLLDLKAATEPVGTLMVAGRGADFVSTDPGLFSALADMKLRTGGALGDSLKTAFQGGEIAAFDSLGAPFWHSMDSLISSEQTGILESQLFSFMDFSSGGSGYAPGPAEPDGRTSFVKPRVRAGAFGAHAGAPAAIFARAGEPVVFSSHNFLREKGHLGFLENHLSLGFDTAGGFAVSTFASPPQTERPSSGAVLSYAPPGLPFSLRSGWVMESESFFGSYSTGAFGELSAVTGFAGVGFDYGFGGWRLSVDAEAGTASAGGNGGVIGDTSAIFTSAFSASVVKDFPGGLRFRLSMLSPLRVESGSMSLSVPGGRTLRGGITRDLLVANLSPSGRQMDFSAQVVIPVPVGNMSVGAVATRHPEHDKTREPSFSLLAGYTARF
ncbi:S8 family peptidase [Candidatus Mycalebacterium sp.]